MRKHIGTYRKFNAKTHRHLEEIQCEKRSVLLSSDPLPLQPWLLSPCPRPALARCYSPPRWPPWDEGAALPFPPGTASSPCPARDVRPPPRVSPLRGIALWKPQPAQPPRSQRPERGLAERMRSPARRVPLLAHLSSTCCGPIHPPLAVLQASPRGGQLSATPQLPCSLTQRLRSSLQLPCTFVPLLPPTSGSLSHSWPASVRPLRR